MLRSRLGRAARYQKRRSLLALLGIALLAGNARAADILVTTNADSGPGSLREAFTTAASGDRIVFDIAGTPTIVLSSDLPTVTGDISFANNNPTAVTIDRNGNAALDFQGSLVDPTVLVVTTGGVASLDADIITAAGTTVYGNGDVVGNLDAPGTIAPGASANPGTIGTFNVTGDLNLAGSQVQLDISTAGPAPSNDVINVIGTVDVSGATLAPNFIGNQFVAGQTFLVLDTTNSLVGSFTNQTSVFALPGNPFLQAVANGSLGPDDFGFVIEDNGSPFTSVVSGCNQLSAAALLDELRTSGSPPAAIDALRSGSTAQVALAADQLSGSIYPSLIGAETNQIINSIESVRDLAALQSISWTGQQSWTPWIRGYGLSGEVSQDNCQTPGYRHSVGGLELGCGWSSGSGMSSCLFTHLTRGNLHTRGISQDADIDSYRLGGLFEYLGQHVYLIAAGGGGVQDYQVQRSLTAFEGSSLATSSFDGHSQFGYFEIGANYVGPWTPYLALHATRVELDPITETGDADFALLNNGGAGDSLRGILGLSLTESGVTPLGLATTRLRFGWMHENLDASDTFVSQVANSGAPTGSLIDRGVNPGLDWGFVRMQVDMGVLLGGQFTMAYEGQYNSHSAFNAVFGGAYWVY